MVCYGIVGEDWERAFVWFTYDAMRRAGIGARVLVPDFHFPPPARVTDLRGLQAVPCGGGFIPRQAVRKRLRIAAGLDGLRAIAAGSIPRDDSWSQPGHAPPRTPRHRCTRIGDMQIWRISTGHRYFDAIDAAIGYGPVWTQYGTTAPVFVFNTNAFDEKPPPPCMTYVILGSGLLGLRLVLESNPPSGARLIVYDINPHQLAWTDFVLGNFQRHKTLAGMIDAFRSSHQEASIRPVAPHERANARLQERWYAENRSKLALVSSLPRRSVVADIMSDSGGLLRLLPGGGPTFFMFLDIFEVWRWDENGLVIRDFLSLSKAFRQAVIRLVGDRVAFVPGKDSVRLQLPQQRRTTVNP